MLQQKRSTVTENYWLACTGDRRDRLDCRAADEIRHCVVETVCAESTALNLQFTTRKHTFILRLEHYTSALQIGSQVCVPGHVERLLLHPFHVYYCFPGRVFCLNTVKMSLSCSINDQNYTWQIFRLKFLH